MLVSGPERHQGETGLVLRQAQDRVDRRLKLWLALWRGKPAIAEAVFAMEPMRVVVRAVERLVRAGEHGNVGIAYLGGQQRVLGRLLKADIAGDRRQAEDPDLGSASAIMIATASSEAVSVSMRKLRMGFTYRVCDV